MSLQEENVEQDLNSLETPIEAPSDISSVCDTVPVFSVEKAIPDKPDDVKRSEPTNNIPEKTSEEESIKTEPENQVVSEETNATDTSDKTSSSKSRELKSILALSKEAKLDTNLPAKRKESTRKRDFAKLHSFGLTGKSPTSKSTHDSKSFKFPVTAEAELEEDQFNKPNVVGMDSPKPLKRARTSSRDSIASGPADEGSRKNRRIVPGEIHVFKVILKYKQHTSYKFFALKFI